MLGQTIECGLPEDQDLSSSLRVLHNDARSILDKAATTTEWQKECLNEIFKLTEAEVRLKTTGGGKHREVLVLMYLGVSHNELASYSKPGKVLDPSQIPEIQTEKPKSQPLFQDLPRSLPLNTVQALDHERKPFIHPESPRISEANQPFEQYGDSVSIIVPRTGINSAEESSISDIARPANFAQNTTNYGPGSSETTREAQLEIGTLPRPAPEMERTLDTSNGRPDRAQHAKGPSMTAEEGGETKRQAGDHMDNSLENKSNGLADDIGDIKTTLDIISSAPFPHQATTLKALSTSSENSISKLSPSSTQQVTKPIILAVPLRGKPSSEGSLTFVQHSVGVLSCTDSATMEENIGAMEKLIDACKRALLGLKESEIAVERRKKDLVEAQGLIERRREELHNAEAAERKYGEEIILAESAHRQKQEEADKALECMRRWQQI